MFVQIELTEKQTVRLQDLADSYNRANNTNLKLEEWLNLHLKEVAIQGIISPNLESLESEVAAFRSTRVQEIISQAIQSL